MYFASRHVFLPAPPLIQCCFAWKRFLDQRCKKKTIQIRNWAILRDVKNRPEVASGVWGGTVRVHFDAVCDFAHQAYLLFSLRRAVALQSCSGLANGVAVLEPKSQWFPARDRSSATAISQHSKHQRMCNWRNMLQRPLFKQQWSSRRFHLIWKWPVWRAWYNQ